MKKIEIDLKGVPQTLLLPLLGRAFFSDKPYSPLHDERAVQLVQTLDYDFDQLSKQVGATTLFWIARAYHFDQAIRAFLQQHPKAVIVSLGAGLETAFYRVDNGQLTWVDLDLPEVIELRKKLFSPSDRVHYVAKSILDFSWMEDVKKFGNEFFFFAGGLFMYFTEKEVKDLFLAMADSFAGAELIFDSISKKGLEYANIMLQKSAMKDAVLKWGLDDALTLQNWSPKVKLLAKVPYFKNIKNKFKFPLLLRCKMYFYDFVNKSGIIHLKLG